MFNRMVYIDAQDAITGSIIPFSEKTTPYDQFSDVVLASSSIPGVFPATVYPDARAPSGKFVFIDGGVVWGAPLAGAINRCKEIVDEESKITVDILITHTEHMNIEPHTNQTHTADNWFRNRDIKNYENGLAGVLKFMVDFPDVNFRHFAIPSKPIGPGATRLNFEDNFTWPM